MSIIFSLLFLHLTLIFISFFFCDPTVPPHWHANLRSLQTTFLKFLLYILIYTINIIYIIFVFSSFNITQHNYQWVQNKKRTIMSIFYCKILTFLKLHNYSTHKHKTTQRQRNFIKWRFWFKENIKCLKGLRNKIIPVIFLLKLRI